MVPAGHTPRQPLQNPPSGHPGGWATPWSAEEMLDGRHQRVNIPAYARAAHKGLLHERLEEGLCWIVPHDPLTSRDWTQLTWPQTPGVESATLRKTFSIDLALLWGASDAEIKVPFVANPELLEVLSLLSLESVRIQLCLLSLLPGISSF